MRYLAVVLALLAACAADRPTVASWIEEEWVPLVQTVPEPGSVTRDACNDALGELRELATGLDPAPSEEVGEAAQGWLNAAESLMFSCASETDFDYATPHERLVLRQAEVEILLEGS